MTNPSSQLKLAVARGLNAFHLLLLNVLVMAASGFIVLNTASGQTVPPEQRSSEEFGARFELATVHPEFLKTESRKKRGRFLII